MRRAQKVAHIEPMGVGGGGGRSRAQRNKKESNKEFTCTIILKKCNNVFICILMFYLLSFCFIHGWIIRGLASGHRNIHKLPSSLITHLSNFMTFSADLLVGCWTTSILGGKQVLHFMMHPLHCTVSLFEYWMLRYTYCVICTIRDNIYVICYK